MFSVLIDNNDGLGEVDYTQHVCYEDGVVISRPLNRPGRFECVLVARRNIAVPMISSSVRVVSEIGYSMFVGGVLESPMRKFGGAGLGESEWAYVLVAYTSDAVIDMSPCGYAARLFEVSNQQAWSTLLDACSMNGLAARVLGQDKGCGRLVVDVGSRWADAAGALAFRTLSAYRLQDNQIVILPFGQTTHSIEMARPGLELSLRVPKSSQVNATEVITVGHVEPATYIHELFQGDGTTSNFQLSRPMFERASFHLLKDEFSGIAIDARNWIVNDPASHINLNRDGIGCSGGTGKESQSVISARTGIELGGTVIIEANGVMLKPGSSGQICGLYRGSVTAANCFAAYQVTSTNSSVTVQAVIDNTLSGSAITIDTDRLYAFRLRFQSLEVQRVSQSYAYQSASGVAVRGGDVIPAAGRVTLEMQDVTSGGVAATVILFSSLVASTPASCVLGLFNNVNLFCSLASVQYEQLPPAEIALRSPGQSIFNNQSIGAAATGASCHLTNSGQVLFYPGFVPPENSTIRVMYRTRQRATARAMSEPAQGAAVKKVSALGLVQQPDTMSSVDCRNAANVLLSYMQNPSESDALDAATYLQGSSDADVWPGDCVTINTTSGGVYAQGIVKEAKFTFLGTDPQGIVVNLLFADAQGGRVGIAVSKAVPADTLLPLPSRVTELPSLNLNGLMVLNTDAASVQVDTGMSAPDGGGFEVRYRDETFGLDDDSDLVARANTQVFSLPRQTASERYYIRMYDGSTPPAYSCFSVALLINVPL